LIVALQESRGDQELVPVLRPEITATVRMPGETSGREIL